MQTQLLMEEVKLPFKMSKWQFKCFRKQSWCIGLTRCHLEGSIALLSPWADVLSRVLPLASRETLAFLAKRWFGAT